MKKIIIPSKGFDSHYDVTPYIEQAIKETEHKEGMLEVCALGSTLGLVVMRYEEGAVKDLFDALERIAPADLEYEHFKTTQDDNGFAHIKSCILGQSITLPVIEGELVIPDKHKIVLFDFDLRASERKLYVHCM